MSGPFPPASGLLRLALACDLNRVHEAAQTVRHFLQEQGCSAAEVVDLELALVEACNNAIEYARPGAGDKTVLLEACCQQALVELRVTDHTAGFQWPTTARLPAPDAESGRGLFLIQAVMDETQYLCGEDCNTLVLRKKRMTR